MTYLGYKEVQQILGCSRDNAYNVIKELREKTKWCDTYECRKLKRTVIPKQIFLKYFPSCKQAIKEIEKKEVSA